jgi:translation initiation factor 5B
VEAEANKLGVKIFTADIIYHLEEAFIKYMEQIKSEQNKASEDEVVWPVVLEVMILLLI